ncbi:glycoside hydrolase domain-containing protein [Buchananella felis]|uniref:glycoside hydrolase domain-containing protein n=1 Tax=Buchananella felis TaxID=3231492 RepID=UPI0035284B02
MKTKHPARSVALSTSFGVLLSSIFTLSSPAMADLKANPNRAAPASSVASSTVVMAGKAALGDGINEDLTLTDLAVRGQGGWMRYRIPALTQLNNGDLLAVFDGRPTMRDLPSNITLLMRRSTDGGKTWQGAQVIRQESAPNGFGDPSLLVDRQTGKVFVFYAASINAGFANSTTGAGATDPNVLHADYSVSEDNGVSWSHHRITADIKAGSTDMAGMFAASGEGLQLRQGEKAGRLIQQYTVRKGAGNYALSVYSDDHGATWHAGGLVGPGADENKVVELSDGTVLLSSRAAPARKIARSNDAGLTYSPFETDPNLPDPGNNGSIIRAFPDAAPNSPQARMLLMSNTANSNVRRNLTVRMSCDDGQTWPVSKVVQSGASAYSTLTALKEGSGERGGKYGLFYERDGYRYLSYTSFDLEWLGGVCASMGQTSEVTGTQGAQVTVPVEITNQSGADLAAGQLEVVTPGWAAAPVNVAQILAGGKATANVQLTIPAGADQRRHPVTVRFTNAAGSAQFNAVVEVNSPLPAEAAAPNVEIRPVLDAIYPGGVDGIVGDKIQPWVEVVNSGNVAVNVAFSAPAGAANCNVNNLAPGATSVCRNNSPSHVVTQEDVIAGDWSTTYTATATGGGKSVEASAKLVPVNVQDSVSFSTEVGVWTPINTTFATSSFTRVPLVGAIGDEAPPGTPLKLTVPANSRSSAQLVVTPQKDVAKLQVEVSALKQAEHDLGQIVQVRYPLYIPDLNNPGQLVADPLSSENTIEVGANYNQPVWFTVRMPENAKEGTYRATVQVKADDKLVASYPLEVTVPKAKLRPVAKRPFILDMWFHPDAVADYNELQPWSDAHFAALVPYWKEQAEAGQDVLDLAVVEDPWLVQLNTGTIHAQTAFPYRSTVEWKFDGTSWSFDYTVFDRLVTEARSNGIGKRIHAFAPLQFQSRDRLYYLDTTTGKHVSVSMGITDQRYRAAWVAFLRDFKRHLIQQGWFDDTSLAFDEQPAARMEQAFSFIKEADPAWEPKIALAANTLAEADLANFISFNYTFLDQVSQDLIERRRRAGEPTLFYTWNEPAKPNTVVKTPPFNARTIGWVVEQRNLDGYLRWTFNSWPLDVYNNPSFRYGQGDEYVIYPGEQGPVSSIRWEVFKDGLEDAELLNLAKEKLGQGNATLRLALSSVRAEDDATRTNFDKLNGLRDALLAALGDENLTSVTVGKVQLDRTAVEDPSNPITASVELRNITDQERTVTVNVVGELFAAAPTTVTLAPLEAKTAQVEFSTRGKVGIDTVQIRVSAGPSELVSQSFPVVAGGFYLSDQTWTQVSNGWGPVEKDRSNGEDQAGDGGPLRMGGKLYSKGLGTHAASQVDVTVPAHCKELIFDYGIDDVQRRPGSAASVVFEVKSGATSLWRSGLMTASTPTGSARVALNGQTQLSLLVDPQGRNGQDHADWAGMWVRCSDNVEIPTTAPTSAPPTTAPPTTAPPTTAPPTTAPPTTAPPTTAPPTVPTVPAQVRRLSGVDRVKTAIEVARAEKWGRTAILASGNNYADALAAGPLAAAHNAPVLLTTGAQLESEVLGVLREKGITKVIVVGGSGSVSPGKLAALQRAGHGVERVFGVDRYDTAVQVAKATERVTGSKKMVYVVDGTNFPDGVAAGALAGRTGGVVVFSAGKALPQVTDGYLNAGLRVVGVGAAAHALSKNGFIAGLTMETVVGATRYETAADLVSTYAPAGTRVVVVSGATYADTLAGGALAASHDGVLLLSRASTLPAAASAVITERKPRFVDIVGGMASVNAGVERALRQLLR